VTQNIIAGMNKQLSEVNDIIKLLEKAEKLNLNY